LALVRKGYKVAKLDKNVKQKSRHEKKLRLKKKVETQGKSRDARKNLKHEKKVEKYEIQAQCLDGNVTDPRTL
jgi:hypothetical protein